MEPVAEVEPDAAEAPADTALTIAVVLFVLAAGFAVASAAMAFGTATGLLCAAGFTLAASIWFLRVAISHQAPAGTAEGSVT
jgi:hypothetical protein